MADALLAPPARGWGVRPPDVDGSATPEVTVGLLGVSLTVLLMAALSGSAPTPSTHARPVESPTVAAPTEEQRLHINAVGGYSFEPPAGWAVHDRGSASELISPDGGVVVSFGLGRPGTLSGAIGALLDSVRGRYDDVRFGELERTHVDGHRAAVVSGGLLNEHGVRVRFLGLAMRVGGANRVMAVFVAQPADPAEVIPAIELLVGSFGAVEPSGPEGGFASSASP